MGFILLLPPAWIQKRFDKIISRLKKKCFRKILNPALQTFCSDQAAPDVKSPVTLYGYTKNECEEFLQTHTPQREPIMNSIDKDTFLSYLKKVKQNNPDMVYVEWGSGGSTYIAVQYAKFVISIENHDEWCVKMTTDKYIQCNIILGKLLFVCAYGGETRFIGFPAHKETYNSTIYITALENFNYNPDFVLIDGRFRVATALGIVSFLNLIFSLL